MTRSQHRGPGPTLLAIVLAGAATAQAATIPASESFESYTNGHPITSQSDWSGTEVDAGIVTNSPSVIGALTTYTNAGHAYPLPGATHDNVLETTAALTNTVSSASGGIIITDMLLMPSQRETVPEGSTDYQFACYVDTNDLLNVWYDAGASNAWITLTNSPALETGVWVRLSVHSAYASHRYKVAINNTAISDGRGWSAAAGGVHPGPWFDMVQTNGYMTRFRTDGDKTAYLDDLVFTNRSLSYSGTTFFEAAANDGTIDNEPPLLVTITGDTLSGTTGDDFVAAGKLLTNSVPPGLSVVATRTNDTTLSIALTGTALLHGSGVDVNDMAFTFADTAFALGNAADVTGYTRSDLVVDFFDAPELSYSSSSFIESGVNDGSIADGATLTVQARTWAGSVGTNYVTGGAVNVSGVPSGLSVAITKTGINQASLSFSGNASPHTSAQNTSGMTFTFQNAAFTEGDAANVQGYARNDLSVTFFDPFALSYSRTTFVELSDGQIDNTDPLIITLANDTFAAGTDFASEAKLSVVNLPNGLTAVAERTSDRELSVTLTGTASNHADSNDISNLSFTFQNSAFASAQASAVANYNRADLLVDFNDSTVTINPVPYRESFETYSDGFQIAGTNGWQETGVNAGTVTTEAGILSALTANFSDFPIETNHTQMLRLNDEITDEIKSGSGGLVYSDMMLYITARDQEPDGSTNYQFAFYVDTNGYPVVWHRDTGGTPTNTWITLTGAPTLTTGAWHRITVVQDYAAQKFRIHLNRGESPLVNPTGTEGWFNMVGTANAYMSRLRLQGGTAALATYIDDICVNTVKPSFLSQVGTLFRFK